MKVVAVHKRGLAGFVLLAALLPASPAAEAGAGNLDPEQDHFGKS